MSDEQRVQQEPDAVPGRRLLALVGGALVAAVLGVFVSSAMLEHSRAHAAASSALEQSPLERTLIERSQGGLEAQAAQRASLRRFGWADRDAGVAQIPIERAMAIIADGGLP